jgi:energy-coupling factor transporter ATP-binding protein EcfA2
MSYINDEKVTYFAETDFRGAKTRFGIKGKDRTKHTYILGKTGMGKSTLLENMAIQDIQNDEGVIFIDPHGSSAVKILEYVPKHRVDDVVYFSPNDIDFPLSFNVLERVAPEKRSFVAQGLMNTFKKIWVDQFSSRMEFLLNYCLLALLETPDATILGVNRLLGDFDYRNHVIECISDPMVRNFWANEYEKYSKDYAAEAVAPIQSKVGQFVTNPMIRNILGQAESKIDFRKLIDEKKIVVVNLSKGLIGPENMRLVGGMLITKIHIATMSRADMTATQMENAAPCYLYVDEFQNFANNAFSEILSESRKYKLALTMANQYFDQVEESVRKAILGNVGTTILFRVGSTDAELMQSEFAPTFTAENIVNLQFTQIYLRLMIDGVTSKPFSATTLLPIKSPEEKYLEDIVFVSRQKYTMPKKEVEDAIRKWNMTSFKVEEEILETHTETTKSSPSLSFVKGEEQNSEKIPSEVKTEDDFNFADDFVDDFDNIEDEDLVDEILTNEEKNILEDEKVKIPEIEVQDFENFSEKEKEKEKEENKLSVSFTRKNAKLLATVSHIKSPPHSTPVYQGEEERINTKKEVPEDILRNLLDN